jgi:hypothetical protein
MEAPHTLEQHRELLGAAREALAALSGVLFQAPGSELGPLLTEVDALAAAAAGARCEIVLEATRRGEISESGRSTREWVFEYAPSQRQGGCSQLASLVTKVATRTGFGAGLVAPELTQTDSPIALIWARVVTGEVAPPLALAALTEMDRIADRLVPEAVPTVTTAMLDIGVGFGRTSMSELRIRLLAQHGRGDEVEDEQRRLRQHAYLSAPDVDSGDLTTYRMGLTPEQATALEAALGPLARPRPNEETGERDLRSNGQRRAEALLEIVGRAQSADARVARGPAEADTCVYVTVGLEALQRHEGAGEVLVSSASGTLLGVETLRRMCCDADLIPVVLGTDGQPLDHGRVERLFTRAQRRAVWRRDRHCTYPGCTAPGAWTQVHHVRHWADGGATDLDNAALLCQRHHTHVHDKRLWAEVRPGPDEGGRHVHWDTRPGSYDIALARLSENTPWRAA